MKKSILAMAVVAATSFNVMADEVVKPVEPKWNLGQEVVAAAQAKLDTVVYDSNTNTLTFTKADASTVDLVVTQDEFGKYTLTNGADSYTFDRTEEGFVVIHNDGNNNTTKLVKEGIDLTRGDMGGKFLDKVIVDDNDDTTVDFQYSEEVRAYLEKVVLSDGELSQRAKDWIGKKAYQDGSINPELHEKVIEALGGRENIRKHIENRTELSNERKVQVLNTVALRNGKAGGFELEMVDGKNVLKNSDGSVVTEQQIADAKAEVKTWVEEKQVTPLPPRKPTNPELDGKVAKKVVEKLEDAGEQAQERAEDAGYSIADLYNAQSVQTEAAISDLYNQIDRLDEKMDGVMAGTHAINNARPFLSGEGQTAVGVGVGYAGESGAVAIGAAHSFTENWSASATLNVTTGSYSEVSGGAGIQYVF